MRVFALLVSLLLCVNALQVPSSRSTPRLKPLTAVAATFAGKAVASTWTNLKQARDNEIGEMCVAIANGLLVGTAIKSAKRLLVLIEKVRSPSAVFPVSPLLGGVLVSLLYLLQPDMMTGAASIGSVEGFSLKRQILRFVAVLVAVGSGNALALAGPAAELGMTTGRILSGGASRGNGLSRSLILGGAAAGFTANFDSPIAGVLYALEVSKRAVIIPRDENRPPHRELCLLVLSAFASAIALRGCFGLGSYSKGPLAAFAYPQLTSNHYPSLLLIAGTAGALVPFIQGPLKRCISKIYDAVPKLIRPAVGGGIASLAQMSGLPQSLPAIYKYFGHFASGKLASYALVQFMVTKAVCTQSCMMSGQIGGMIAPFLIVGSALGALIGNWVDSSIIASFAAIGSASVLSAFYQAPLAFAILIVEMTQQLHLAVPLLIVGSLSVAVSDAIQRRKNL